MGLGYEIAFLYVRLSVGFFFRRVQISGLENVPKDKPLVLAGNHPNGLMDPIIVMYTASQAGRRITPTAKDTLFKVPIVGQLAWAVGAVPIARRMDRKPGGKVDNSNAFSKLFEVVGAGGAMMMFPEGISHTGSELAEMKTGCARVALGVMQQEHVAVSVVPVGIMYTNPTQWRSSVFVNFGEPITVDEAWLPLQEEDGRIASKALTAQIDDALRAQTINATDWEVISIVQTARRIYKPDKLRLTPADVYELTQRFLAGYRAIKEAQDPVGLELERELIEYRDDLEAIGLADHNLRKPVSGCAVFGRILMALFWVLIITPLAAPGFLIHFPILLMAWIGGCTEKTDMDVVSTKKLMFATAFIPLTYIGLSIAAYFVYNAILADRPVWEGILVALGTFLLMPAASWVTMTVMQRNSRTWKSTVSLFRLMTFRTRVQELRVRRDALRAKINDMVDKYHDVSKPRLFNTSKAALNVDPSVLLGADSIDEVPEEIGAGGTRGRDGASRGSRGSKRSSSKRGSLRKSSQQEIVLPNEIDIRYRGEMMKQGDAALFGGKGWKLRYFIMTYTTLTYYENEPTNLTKDAPRGQIRLDEIIGLHKVEAAKMSGDADKDRFYFEVQTNRKSGRVFFFSTATSEERDRWLVALHAQKLGPKAPRGNIPLSPRPLHV